MENIIQADEEHACRQHKLPLHFRKLEFTNVLLVVGIKVLLYSSYFYFNWLFFIMKEFIYPIYIYKFDVHSHILFIILGLLSFN